MQGDVARQRALDELDVAIDVALDTLGPADLVGGSQLRVDFFLEQGLDLLFDFVGELVAVRAEQFYAVVCEGIVGGGDHYADVGAQRARQHGDGGCRDRAEQEHVEASGGESGNQGVFQHVAGKPGVLADHHPVAMVSPTEDRADRNADPHGEIRGHGKLVGLTTNAVRTEIATSYLFSCKDQAGTERRGERRWIPKPAKRPEAMQCACSCHKKLRRARKLASTAHTSCERKEKGHPPLSGVASAFICARFSGAGAQGRLPVRRLWGRPSWRRPRELPSCVRTDLRRPCRVPAFRRATAP